MTVVRSASGIRIDCDGCAHHTAAPSFPLEVLRSTTGYVHHDGRDFCPSCWYAHTTSQPGTSSHSSAAAAAPAEVGLSTVVIVDDHPNFREAARLLLEARGYHVVGEAGSAASALRAVEDHTPQAVLLDVHLGDDDGYAVCGLLTRSRPALAVLLTSADEERDSGRITSCGARGFVPKSLLPEVDFEEFWPGE